MKTIKALYKIPSVYRFVIVMFGSVSGRTAISTESVTVKRHQPLHLPLQWPLVFVSRCCCFSPLLFSIAQHFTRSGSCQEGPGAPVLHSQRRIKQKDVTQIKPGDSWASSSLQSIDRITAASIRRQMRARKINLKTEPCTHAPPNPLRPTGKLYGWLGWEYIP